MKALILYYSCSNNTGRLAAEAEKTLAARGWETQIGHLRDFRDRPYPTEADLIVLGVPVQYWDIPEPAKAMIQKMPCYEKTFAFVFSTFGGCVCNSVPYQLAVALSAKHVTTLGGAQILSPHSAKVNGKQRLGDLETAFGKGQPDDATLERFRSAIRGIAGKIEKNDTAQIPLTLLKNLHTRGLPASIVNGITNARRRKDFLPHIGHDAVKCVHCGQCVEACDAEAIAANAQGLVTIDKKRCNKCYKCTDVCPSEALNTDWQRVVFWTRSVHKLVKDPVTRFVP